MPNFEVLDARIASALNKIIHNSHFKRRVSLEEQKAQKHDRFLRGRQIAYLIYDYFQVTGANDSVENYTDLFTIVLRNDDIQEFDSKPGRNFIVHNEDPGTKQRGGETEWQEQGARETAWKLAKSVFKNEMISRKDLSDAEMDSLTKSCCPTIVITANGEVQTHEEAIVFVKELDIFLTMKVLNNTPAVLSLGKLFDENGYSYEWINGQKTTSH